MKPSLFGIISLVLCLCSLSLISPIVVRSVSAYPLHPKDPIFGIAPEGPPLVCFLSSHYLFAFCHFQFNVGIFFYTADEKYYKTSSDLVSCKDGSKKFTKAQLNDDFCDCPDGTDEPGSSLYFLRVYFPFIDFIQIVPTCLQSLSLSHLLLTTWDTF